MSKKIKVVNNIKGSLGFYLSPTEDSFRVLPRQGAFLNLTKDELGYININQTIIQTGMLWIDDKDTRVDYGFEKEDGTKENLNVIKYDEIKEVIEGNYKTLVSTLKKITEPTILLQFVEVARDTELDSAAKIKAIEEASKITIFEED